MSRRHHYIPQYYLKGFTDSRSPKQIWVYPKDGTEPFRTGIVNVGVASHYYSVTDENGIRDSDTIERFLAEDIEQPANSVIDKIRNTIPITAEEKYTLSVYIAGMLTRVPKNRERVGRDIPRLVQQAREVTRETLHELASDSSEDQARLERLLTETEQGFVNIERSLIDELSLPHFREEVITTINSMTWALFTSGRKSSFLTNDNPFCYTESEGMLKDSSMFIFPVSSRIVLIGSWTPPRYGDFAIWYAPLGRDASNVINRVLVRCATRYVYHRTRSRWVSDMIRQGNESNDSKANNG